MRHVFLDHAATTAIDGRVKAFLAEALGEPQNPSSVHFHGQRALARLEEARERMANLLGVARQDVVFTSGATEGNNLVLRGSVAAMPLGGRRLAVLSSQLEHSCVRETAARLAASGDIVLSLMKVNAAGLARVPSEPPQCDLLCMMAVQNETGVIQDMTAAREFLTQTTAKWLCDLTQGFALMEPEEFAGADFYTLSSHKIHGPPGVGALAGRGVASLRPQITGGPQERELRAGTQAVALIRAFVMAAEICREDRKEKRAKMAALCARYFPKLKALGIEFAINGDQAKVLPGFLNLSFSGITGADMMIALDTNGFSISAGAACATGVMEPSPAMVAMFPNDVARAAGAVRITPGKETTTEEMDALAESIAVIATRSRRRAGR